MDTFINNSFITPLAATAALLPYVGAKKSSSNVRASISTHTPVVHSSSSSYTTVKRPSDSTQRLEASRVLMEKLHYVYTLLSDPTTITGLTATLLLNSSSSVSNKENEGRTISSLSSFSSSSTGNTTNGGPTLSTLNLNIIQLLMNYDTSTKDQFPHYPLVQDNILMNKDKMEDSVSSTTSSSLPIAFGQCLWSMIVTPTPTTSSSSSTVLSSSSSSSSLPSSNEISKRPQWLLHIFTDLLLESFDNYSSSGNSMSSTDYNNEVLYPSSIGKIFQKLGFFHVPMFRTLLRTVLKSIITKYIRQMVVDGDTETSIRIECLRWTAEKLLPWMALLLFSCTDLEGLSKIILQHKELFLRTVDNGNNVSSSSYSSDSPYTNDERTYIEALRVANILPTVLPSSPHPHLNLVFSGGSPNYDDGTGGNTVIMKVNPVSLETLIPSSSSVIPSTTVAYTLGELLLLLQYYDNFAYMHVQSCICQARIEQAFDLIRDYPDSLPALYDLRDTLPILGESAQAKLISTLTAALRNRLLHPGVATSSILDVFLSTVRCLRIIEGDNESINMNTGGILLSLIIDPIQCYLRTRADTIRCIVSSLTEDTESELYSELVRKDTKAIVESRGGDDSDDEDIAPSSTNINAPNVINTIPEQSWNPNSSFLQMVIDKETERKEANDANDDDERNGTTMNDDTEAEESQSLQTIRALYYILGTQFRYALPTNPFARGKHLFNESVNGIYSSLGNNRTIALSYGNQVKGLWYPSPIIIDAVQTVGLNSNRINTTNRYNDLLSLLVNIYGSKEMFVTEYRTMLSDRLLAKAPKDYDISNEERTVELLKLRFGDTALISTEIMLRDIIESKRVSVAITNGMNKKGTRIRQRQTATTTELTVETNVTQPVTDNSNDEDTPIVSDVYNTQTTVDAIILSYKYWPILPREQPILAPALTSLFKSVATEYAEAKKPRELNLVPSLGEIEAEIEVPLTKDDEPDTNDDEEEEDMDIEEQSNRSNRTTKTITVTGNLQQVSVLLHMAGKQCIGLKELSKLLNISIPPCLRLVGYWMNKGILTMQRHTDTQEDIVWITNCLAKNTMRNSNNGNNSNNNDGNVSIHHHPTTTTMYDDHGMDNGDDNSAATMGGDDPEAIMLWHSYIIGMLSNLGSMPIDRIYNTLKMFASMGDYPYEKSLTETTRFLADMVRSDKLELADGMYSLKN